MVERGPNLAIKVDFRVLASTTHGRWNEETRDFLKLCADTKLSNYNTSSYHDASNEPGSTGAPKWVKQQQIRRWGARLAVALQKGNLNAITSGIVAIYVLETNKYNDLILAPVPTGMTTLALSLVPSTQTQHSSPGNSESSEPQV